VSANATECPRIKPEFLAEERKEKTADSFAQEYMCEFTASEDALFDRSLIEGAMDDIVTELDIPRRW
jgi:phage FluMu gp28-like protein